MTMLARPATYPGGKNGSGVYQAIINLMPPHKIYVEPFLGNGAIMRLKRPAIASIGIDSDTNVVANWKGNEVPRLTLLNLDALNYLVGFPPTPDSLIYCDPPYLMSTRSCKRPIYRHEFSDEAQHTELLTLIKRLNCMVMISGYYSDLYARELAGWRIATFQAQTRGGTSATEWVWMNFPEPLELHDYRYLGGNFRQRERIKRKQNRWRARLLRMNSTERYSMLATLEELRTAPPQTAMGSNTPPDSTMGAPIAKNGVLR
jgi:hypothetical protein